MLILSPLWRRIKKNYYNIPFVKERRRTVAAFRALKYAIFFASAVLFILASIFFVHFAGLKLVYRNVISGKADLENAIFLMEEKNEAPAAEPAAAAERKFAFAADRIGRYRQSGLVRRIDFLRAIADDLYYLAAGGEIAAKSVARAAAFARQAEFFLDGGRIADFIRLEQPEKKKILRTIYEAAPDMAGAIANADLALLNLENTGLAGPARFYPDNIRDFRDYLMVSREYVSGPASWSELLPAALGYPARSRYLIIFQDKNELAPAGGVIGAYGILDLENGGIVSFATHDAYYDTGTIDGSAAEIPAFAGKIAGTGGRLFLRDAGFSPDWPATAGIIENFFRDPGSGPGGENGFSGIIAVTADFFADLLDLLGPVAVDGNEYGRDNVSGLFRADRRKIYASSRAAPSGKEEAIGRVFAGLYDKTAGGLSSAESYALAHVISRNLAEKNILLHFREDRIEEEAAARDWAGEMKKSAGDYFMTVDTDQAGSASAGLVSKSLSYAFDHSDSGIFADLQINYSHHGGRDDKDYASYARAYVPRGSVLVSAGDRPPGGVDIYEDGGKTVFGTPLSVSPGKIFNLRFYYKLPPDIEEMIRSGTYSLYAQKQPGTDAFPLRIDLNFMNGIRLYRPNGFHVSRENDNMVGWESDLSSDREFSVEF